MERKGGREGRRKNKIAPQSWDIKSKSVFATVARVHAGQILLISVEAF